MKFIVRHIVKEDLPVLYNFIQDQEIVNLINYDRYETYESFAERYQLYFSGKNDDLKIFTITLDDNIIGKMEIGYDLQDKSALFEILIGDKKLWGKGLGKKSLNVLFSYGFNNLGLNRIACEVLHYNERMIRLMDSMKMNIDGILREARFIDGQFVDIFIFSKLRKEYEGDVF